MGIRLMAHIPEQSIVRGVEHMVQGDRQLNYTESGGEVTTGLRDRVDQELSNLRRHCRQVTGGQCAEISGRIDPLEQWVCPTGWAFWHENGPNSCSTIL